MASAGGAAARTGSANAVPTIRAEEPLSRSRRESFDAMVMLLLGRSHLEQLAVARLDFSALFFDGRRILLHGFDLLEGLAAGMLLGLWMQRTQPADVDDELLA